MLFDRRLLKSIDKTLLALVLLVVTIGIVNLYSAGLNVSPETGTPLYIKQIYWLGIGLGLMLVTLACDYRNLEKLAYPFYFLTIILLVGVMVGGKVVSGSKRWLVMGPFTFQPSELAKLAIVLAMARHFYQRESPKPLGWTELVTPFLLLAAPFALIVKQPDLGSALLVAGVGGSMILFMRVRWHILLITGLSAVVASPVLWHLLKDYQKKRILTFLNPEHDPLGAGYHIIQSKIAVGSGLVWGKGFLQGAQSQLGFLPEQHTDFVFSVFSEEWGFLGCVVVIMIYTAIILRGLQTARQCRERFGNLLATGISAMIFWQLFINISMVTGMLPVVGIPLPLFSYGGSSLISTFIGVGLLINIRMRLFLFNK